MQDTDQKLMDENNAALRIFRANTDKLAFLAGAYYDVLRLQTEICMCRYTLLVRFSEISNGRTNPFCLRVSFPTTLPRLLLCSEKVADRLRNLYHVANFVLATGCFGINMLLFEFSSSGKNNPRHREPWPPSDRTARKRRFPSP